jgi:tripartite ATP-independent transporter DctP family solute receptor
VQRKVRWAISTLVVGVIVTLVVIHVRGERASVEGLRYWSDIAVLDAYADELGLVMVRSRGPEPEAFARRVDGQGSDVETLEVSGSAHDGGAIVVLRLTRERRERALISFGVVNLYQISACYRWVLGVSVDDYKPQRLNECPDGPVIDLGPQPVEPRLPLGIEDRLHERLERLAGVDDVTAAAVADAARAAYTDTELEARDAGVAPDELLSADEILAGDDSVATVDGAGVVTAVADGSDGRISVEGFAGGQLANANQQAELEAVQQGTIDALWVSPIILALFMDQRFDIYSLPFLFSDHEQANEVVDGPVGEMTEGWLREGGLEPLGWGVNGFRQITNNDGPITEPSDVEGLRLRVAGTDMYLQTFDLLGADALTMSFGEVFTSLQQGVLDGQENPLSIIYSSSLQEVQNHVSIWNYSYDPLVLAMNDQIFAGLCAQDQDLLRTAAIDAGELQRELSIQEDIDLPQQLEAEGMTVTPYEDVDIEAFQDLIVEPIYSEWESIIGADELQMMLDAVEQASS